MYLEAAFGQLPHEAVIRRSPPDSSATQMFGLRSSRERQK